ncbi:MAG: phosphoribosylformylglycinamidine synthase subunit PurS [Cytophagia bacterium]|nr:MAG: phosphoribosylformylglycinamidine synthase subunit PurS [Cytophagales bacterium]TAG01681.1 MAG: phosphoribosylformylglycinamidine synthase subunit PurS [Cytophagia bacterium]TAG45807.1 MAG: phosphoribosylformylglycinamidine synthase subunit PurS [Cytophagia bacterium]TAH29267.1 MAG: phosphoribosylformylglycinamidine synthase subunit PurS [Cytophagales bacterium]
MNFRAAIDVMTKKEILDPQGKAVKLGLNNIGIDAIKDVRIGRHIVVEIEADNETEAQQKIEIACKKLLANLIMEDYHYTISKI